MGLTIYCKKTGHGIDMGYGGFSRLRDKIAELAGEPFGSHVKKLGQNPYMFSSLTMTPEQRKALFDEYNAETQRMVDEKLVSIKIVDFCLQPDCGGKIRYGACKEILRIIGDYDNNVIYGYCGCTNPAKFADFKAILQECVDNRCMMVWK